MADLHIKRLNHDHEIWQKLCEEHKTKECELIEVCKVNQWLYVLITRDGKERLWHLSVSHPNRYPTWDEIKELRYALLPNEITVGILLPPIEQYVNLHPNCFHLHEVPEAHEGRIIIP